MRHSPGVRDRRNQSETLEPRILLATVNWDGGAGTFNWNDAANWAGDVLPGVADDVVIGDLTGTPTITSSGTVTINSIDSSEHLAIAGGSFAIPGTSQLSAGLTLSAGTLVLNGDLTVLGSSSWTDGTVTGSGSLENAGTLVINAVPNPVTLSGATLVNTGVVIQAGGTFRLNTGAVFENQLTGIYDLAGDVTIINLSGTSTFNNAGIFRKSAGAGVSALGGVFTFNNLGGTVDVQTGTLSLRGGTSTGGTYNAEAGTVLHLTGGQTQTWTGTHTGTGTGTIQIHGTSTINIGAGGATVDFDQPGLFRLRDGATLGAGANVLTNTGSITIDPGPAGSVAWGGTIANDGTITHINGTVRLSSATINNLATGVYDLAGDGGFASIAGVHTFNNAGILRKSAGTGTSSSPTTLAVNNTGTVEVETGTLVLPGTISQHVGTTLTGGTWDLAGTLTFNNLAPNITAIGSGASVLLHAGSTFSKLDGGSLTQNQGFLSVTGRTLNTGGPFNNSGTIEIGTGGVLSNAAVVYTQTAGQIHLAGGSIVAGSLNLNGGSLSGDGTITANVTNAATVTIGSSPGVLAINGDYTQTAAGVLDVEIGGTDALAPDFDQLLISGSANLDGMLDASFINDFVADKLDVFRILTYASLVGDFATKNLPSQNGTDLLFADDQATFYDLLGRAIIVTNTNDSGTRSLRDSITRANTDAGADLILFNLTGAGIPTIALTSALPLIADQVTIDGSNLAGNPGVELNGSGAGVNAYGLQFFSGSDGSIVRGLVINRFSRSGIFLNGTTNITVAGNYIGTDVTGTLDMGNSENGVFITLSGNTIGGAAPDARNIISGNNLNGIRIDGPSAMGNTIAGNYIGTDVTGTIDLGNSGNGVVVNASANNTIGGSTAAERNVISGNLQGVFIGGPGATGNTIAGNFIGTDVTGTIALGNHSSGVTIDFGSSNNRVGTDGDGTNDSGERNVISGNLGRGINLNSTSSNIVAGNYIGTDVTGTMDLGNTIYGLVVIGTAAMNTIGGDAAAERNIISGNNSIGLLLSGASVTGNTVAGNYIGTNATGSAALGNALGLRVEAPNNIIGGLTATPGMGQGNVIAGNTVFQVELTGSAATGNSVQGNIIGLDATGTTDLTTSASELVRILAFASGNTIGGSAAGAGNVISGGNGIGINVSSPNNTVQGNFIGTDITGTLDRGNAGSGIVISSSDNTIGGSVLGAENVISGNDDRGILITGAAATNNIIQGNFVGTDAAGTLDLGNATYGIRIDTGAANNTIGGTTAFERNIISGNDFSGVLIAAGSGSNNAVTGNYIGTDVTGTLDLGNSGSGVFILSNDNTVGGTVAGAGNVISGNTLNGITINGAGATGNTVQGNFIGTDKTGTIALGNTEAGVHIEGANNTIGGTTAGSRNIISGNDGDGVFISGTTANGNRVQGNYIGTDVTGTATLGNGSTSAFNGVRIANGSDNLIGGDDDDDGTLDGVVAARNLISGNIGRGIEISGTLATGNFIQGNYIGTDASGNGDLGNEGHGIRVWNFSTGNTIGGATAGAGNVISGNTLSAVTLGETTNAGSNLVEGNLIGLNALGNAAIANVTTSGIGAISIASSDNVIRGNVISGNQGHGILLTSLNGHAHDNVIVGNLIGTDAGGTIDLGNARNGIQISAGAANNLIGGTTAADRNIISGNAADGVHLIGTSATGNVILGNSIGTDITGTADLGNGASGVRISQASNNTVGGTTAGARNVISGNDQRGIYITDAGAAGNVVQGNYIGTDKTGTQQIANLVGVRVEATAGSGNLIGGDDAADGTVDGVVNARNIIAGNHGQIFFVGDGSIAQGNYLGLAPDGTTLVPSTANGITIEGEANLFGGNTPGAGNVIAGLFKGVYLTGDNNTVQGNFIGTDRTGTIVLGNVSDGIHIDGGADNLIGGSSAGDRNLISGNGGNGVTIDDAAATGNRVQGNFIGTDVTGTIDLGNVGDGVQIFVPADNIIGTDGDGLGDAGEGNLIAGNGADGIDISGTGTTVAGNIVGLGADGTMPLGNAGHGIRLRGGTSVLVGSNGDGISDELERNVIADNGGSGVSLEFLSGATIAGNLIGFAADGTTGRANHAGVGGAMLLGGVGGHTIGGPLPAQENLVSGEVQIVSPNNTLQGNRLRGRLTVRSGAANNQIGGTSPGEGNVLATLSIDGIGTDGNLFQGNFIGTNDDGTAGLGQNTGTVIISGGASNNIFGGTTPGARNIISGGAGPTAFHQVAVSISGTGTTGNVFQGNYIGLDATGTVVIGNSRDGIAIGSGADGNIIGGAAPGAGNVIAGSGTFSGNGISILGADNNTVQGNLIGTGPNGTEDFGNQGLGILIMTGADGNLIGGTDPGAGNLIAFNDSNGIQIGNGTLAGGASGNLIQGNKVGVDITGTVAAANSGSGIIVASAPNNTIGGSAPGAGNIISGNTGDGVTVTGSSGNVVAGNLIGTDRTGVREVGNGGHGIFAAVSVLIGTDDNGTNDLAEGNTIAFNALDGVAVTTSGVTIRGNRIHSNEGLGIDYLNDGVTANGSGIQDFPTLLSVQGGASTRIRGTITGPANVDLNVGNTLAVCRGYFGSGGRVWVSR